MQEGGHISNNTLLNVLKRTYLIYKELSFIIQCMSVETLITFTIVPTDIRL